MCATYFTLHVRVNRSKIQKPPNFEGSADLSVKTPTSTGIRVHCHLVTLKAVTNNGCCLLHVLLVS